MKCVKCNKELTTGSVFCDQCGTKVENEVTIYQYNKTLYIAEIVTLVVLSIMMFLPYLNVPILGNFSLFELWQNIKMTGDIFYELGIDSNFLQLISIVYPVIFFANIALILWAIYTAIRKSDICPTPFVCLINIAFPLIIMAGIFSFNLEVNSQAQSFLGSSYDYDVLSLSIVPYLQLLLALAISIIHNHIKRNI